MPFLRILALSAGVAAVWLMAPLAAQKPTPLASNSDEIEVLPVQHQVHLVATGGSNITVQVGPQGPLLVDSGNTEATRAVLNAIAGLSDQPPRWIINTSPLLGHIGGNKAIFAVGQPIPGTVGGLGMPIASHEKAVTRLGSGVLGDVPEDMRPFNTFAGEKKTLYVNDESIELLHMAAAITDGDLMVYFRRSDVLATGDIYVTTAYPRFDSRLGGSLAGVISALNRVIDITVPAFNQQGGTAVIPGHGRISNESDVVEYRDMVTIIRDRIATLKRAGRSFDEVVAARPSLEYDGLYGANTGEWTSRMFLEAVYNGVTAAPGEAGR